MTSPADATSPASPLTARLVQLVRELRRHGITVGTSEVVDAAAVVVALGMDDRERLREGLAATMMRMAGQRSVFDQLFDIHFPAAVGGRAALLDPESPLPDDASPTEKAAHLRELLARALAEGDQAALDFLAVRTVEELGRLRNAASNGGWSAMQALDTLAPQTAIVAALRRARDAGDAEGGSGTGSAGSGDGSGASGGGGSGEGSGGGAGGGSAPGAPRAEHLSDRFDRDEIRAAVAAFRRAVETESTRRNVEVRGAERISRYGVRDPLERRPFLLTGRTDADEIRAVIAPLSRTLASRLAAKQRRHARGTIDIRRTLRASMSTGGVPIAPAWRRRVRGRPDLVLLCDMSGSVSGFSRFTMLLMQSLSGQFRRVRIFGFINVVDEITEQVAAAGLGEDVRDVVVATATMAAWHGNSDYGTALAEFVEHHLDAIGPRTTVLILGDARSNNTDPRPDALREIAAQAKHVAWLNPEPVAQWGSGDSVAPTYAEIVDMHECRNIEQLRLFVTRILPV
ncbi:VWA domain-containing protein [Janibacter sp. G1551]|uniref:VWA domain-containing protein n=1 Tax=Janibacter sp. G1551 TaxID=3420440 RepID=UPI003CFF5B61